MLLGFAGDNTHKESEIFMWYNTTETCRLSRMDYT